MPQLRSAHSSSLLKAQAIFLALALIACGPVEELLPYEEADTRVQVTPDPNIDEYFGTIWPDNRRLDEDGLLSTEDFPGELGFRTTLDSADRLIDGFGLSAPIFVPFTGPIDLESLPQSPEDSLSPEASIYLVAIDGSEQRGQQVPLEWHYSPEATSFLPDNVLAIRPVVGFPLHPKTLYALVITNKVKDIKGSSLGPDEAFFRGLTGFPEDPELGPRYREGGIFFESREHLLPLAQWLDEKRIDPLTIAGAAVFRTQSIKDELLSLTSFLEELPPPKIEEVRLNNTTGTHKLYLAKYEAPYLLQGEVPYLSSGGGIAYDGHTGKPIVEKREEMRLSICVPVGDAPEGGWPVVFVSHGTGGNFLSQNGDRTCELLSREGIASFGIDQMLHGPRAGDKAGLDACYFMPTENCFLNILNAVAGRNILRHSALDHVSLRRAVQNGVDFGDGTQLNTESFGFFGHSQGGLTGGIYLSLDPTIKGALLSGTGGHLSTTLLVRDEGALKDLAEGPIFLGLRGDEELHQFHPALAIVQTLAEAADPLSYGRYWFQEPTGQPKNVFLTSGLDDEMTPYQTTIALAVASGVPQQFGGHTESPEFSLAGLTPTEGTLKGNLESGSSKVTAGLRQFPDQGHFPIFNDPSARHQMARFFRSLMYEEQAEILEVSE